MVSIDVAKIASKVKDGAKVVLNNLKENPAEGSIFDAANKLGINSKEDLKAGFELFKEDPAGTVQTAFQSLTEKGFKFGGEENQEGSKEFSIENIGQNITKATAAKTATTANTTAETVAQTQTTNVVEDTDATEEAQTNDTKDFGGVFGKLGIKNEEDLKAGIQKFKENPSETAQSIAKSLGLSSNVTEKLASIISKIATK